MILISTSFTLCGTCVSTGFALRAPVRYSREKCCAVTYMWPRRLLIQALCCRPLLYCGIATEVTTGARTNRWLGWGACFREGGAASIAQNNPVCDLHVATTSANTGFVLQLLYLLWDRYGSYETCTRKRWLGRGACFREELHHPALVVGIHRLPPALRQPLNRRRPQPRHRGRLAGANRSYIAHQL